MSTEMSQQGYTSVESNKPGMQVDPDYFPIQSPDLWSRLRLRVKRIWHDTWFLEISALMISISCGIGIYATLGALDGKPLPPMPKSLTLNTIVAFLGALAKSSLVLVVSSSIGQLKWSWYQRTRIVQDTGLFDDASRGPLGSLQMLLKHRGKSIACLGALVLILALLFDPFVQQAVVYPHFSVLQPSSLARAKQARVFLTGLQPVWGIPSVAQEALNAGIWSSGFEPKPFCPSSDCLWDTYTSLGLCSSCGPASPYPQLDCNFDPTIPPYNYSTADKTVFETKSCFIKFRDRSVYRELIISFQKFDSPGGTSYNHRVVGPEYALFETYTGEDITEEGQTRKFRNLTNVTIQGVENPLLAFTEVHFNLTSKSLTIVKAEECTLNFCLRDYTMRTSNNTPQIDISNVRNGSGVTPPSQSSDVRGSVYCWVAENETFSDSRNSISDGSFECHQDQKGEDCVFNGTYWYDTNHFSFCMWTAWGPFQNWAGAIGKYLAGGVSQYRPIGRCYEGMPDCKPMPEAYLMDNSSLKTLADSNATLKDSVLHTRLTGLNVVMPNIADSMTLLNLELNGSVVEGRAGDPFTYVHVRWAWLALPSSLLGVGSFLFLYTVIDARKSNIRLWKNSALAVLYHGLEPEELEGEDGVEKASGMEARAAKLKVRLVRGHRDGRTVMQKSEAVARSRF